jgi:hypothetical protein
VKITVIATGFQRESLPEIDRRNPNFPFSVANNPENAMPESLFANSESQTPIPVEAAAPPPATEEPPSVADYEVPAYLRKQRRLVQ